MLLERLDDSKVCEIVKKFYEVFFCTETPDCTQAARALHDALKEVDQDNVGQRIAFPHFGPWTIGFGTKG